MSQYYCWIFFLVSGLLFSQKKYEGTVLDQETRKPLAFANIVFNKNPKTGVTTDIDGKFIWYGQDVEHITCSYIGYETYTTQDISPYTQILLKPAPLDLDEVVIEIGENPANRIIRRVIENKDRNNPEKISSFEYTCYNKTIFDLLKNVSGKQDSIRSKKDSIPDYLFMMESVTQRKFISPNTSEEVIIGTKVSGFRHPNFAALATDLQPFSFYNDNIPLFDINYLNPISKGSLNKYNFYLRDTVFQQKDTIYIISFKPKKNKNFEGLTGVLHINTHHYAVQNVIATPHEKGKIDLRIEQQYTLVNGTHWFPEQLNYEMILTEYKGMSISGRSYISQVKLNPVLRKKDFSIEAVRMDEAAPRRDSLFWDSYRKEPLTLQEKKSYQFIDSIGRMVNSDRFLTFTSKLTDNKIPFGKCDIDLSKTLIYNRYEGFRLGLGVITNENISRYFEIGAFGGYGLRDSHWKYGGSLKIHINKEHEVSLSGGYQDNLIEVGNYGMNRINANRLTIRNYIASRMDNIRETHAGVSFRALRHTQWSIFLRHSKTQPMYEYTFQENGQDITEYTNTDLTLSLRWAPKEKIVQSFNRRIALVGQKPVFHLLVTKGLKNVANSQFDFIKLEGRVEQTFFTKNFGKTSYRIEGGWVNNPLPNGLLFTGEGSFDNNYPYFARFTFQTMHPYEFLSDQYARLFLIHNFNTLLFRTKWLQPAISLHNNLGWGQLQNKQNHLGIDFNTKEKIFMESGIQMDNLIKINYLNIGYFGVGAALFYRYGAYEKERFSDNSVLKITATFTIK